MKFCSPSWNGHTFESVIRNINVFVCMWWWACLVFRSVLCLYCQFLSKFFCSRWCVYPDKHVKNSKQSSFNSICAHSKCVCACEIHVFEIGRFDRESQTARKIIICHKKKNADEPTFIYGLVLLSLESYFYFIAFYCVLLRLILNLSLFREFIYIVKIVIVNAYAVRLYWQAFFTFDSLQIQC